MRRLVHTKLTTTSLYGVEDFLRFQFVGDSAPETTALRQAMKGLQAFEDSLPYDHHKKIREDIPVGVYDVVADFGQGPRRQHGDDSAQ